MYFRYCHIVGQSFCLLVSTSVSTWMWLCTMRNIQTFLPRLSHRIRLDPLECLLQKSKSKHCSLHKSWHKREKTLACFYPLCTSDLLGFHSTLCKPPSSLSSITLHFSIALVFWNKLWFKKKNCDITDEQPIRFTLQSRCTHTCCEFRSQDGRQAFVSMHIFFLHSPLCGSVFPVLCWLLLVRQECSFAAAGLHMVFAGKLTK